MPERFKLPVLQQHTPENEDSIIQLLGDSFLEDKSVFIKSQYLDYYKEKNYHLSAHTDKNGKQFFLADFHPYCRCNNCLKVIDYLFSISDKKETTYIFDYELDIDAIKQHILNNFKSSPTHCDLTFTIPCGVSPLFAVNFIRTYFDEDDFSIYLTCEQSKSKDDTPFVSSFLPKRNFYFLLHVEWGMDKQEIILGTPEIIISDDFSEEEKSEIEVLLSLLEFILDKYYPDQKNTYLDFLD